MSAEFDKHAASYDGGLDNPVKRLMGDSADQFIAVKARWLLRREPALKAGGGRIGGEVSCCGVAVSPGDAVIGDEDGVVVWPGARAAERLEMARQRLETHRERLATSGAEGRRGSRGRSWRPTASQAFVGGAARRRAADGGAAGGAAGLGETRKDLIEDARLQTFRADVVQEK